MPNTLQCMESLDWSNHPCNGPWSMLTVGILDDQLCSIVHLFCVLFLHFWLDIQQLPTRMTGVDLFIFLFRKFWISHLMISTNQWKKTRWLSFEGELFVKRTISHSEPFLCWHGAACSSYFTKPVFGAFLRTREKLTCLILVGLRPSSKENNWSFRIFLPDKQTMLSKRLSFKNGL